MSISDDDLEQKLEILLPRALRNLGYIITPEQLATKEDFEDLKQRMDERFLKIFERMEKHDNEIKEIKGDIKKIWEEIKEIKEENRDIKSDIKKIWEEIKEIKEENRDIKSDIKKIWEEIKEIKEENRDIKRELNRQNDRINKLMLVMNNGFASIDNQFAKFSIKYGKLREEEARKLLDEVLKHFGVPSSKVRNIQVIDQEGIVFAKGYITDVDVYLETDEEVWTFEFKANCNRFDLFGFHKVCELLEKGYGKKVTRKILACFDISDEVKRDAQTFGIEIWKSKTMIPGLVLSDDL